MIRWLFFTLLTLFWGCSFLAIRFTVEVLPPLAAAGLRILIGTLFLLAIALFLRVPTGNVRKMFWRLAGLGLLNFAVPWACLFWGEKTVSPALASIFNSTVPIWVLICAWVLLPDEPPTRVKVIGVSLGFLGILLVFVPGLGGRENLAGMSAILLMAASYGLGAVITKRIGHALDIRWSLVVQGFSAAAVLLGLGFLLEGGDWVSAIWGFHKAIAALLYLAIVSTALAWLMFFRLIKEWGALRASTVTYAMPFVSISVDWFYYHKLPSPLQLTGAAFILSGLSIIHWARLKEARKALRLAA